MNNKIVFNKAQKLAAVVSSVAISLLVVWGAVSGATTISANISTGGTLTVSGVSTLTGLATLDGGALLTASSTAVGKFQVNGAFNASSTMYILGAARFDSGVGLGAANTVAKTLLWSPLTTDPTAAEGLVYYNSTSKVLRMSDGTNWFTVGTSTSGLTLSGNRLQLADLNYYMTFGTTSQQGLSMMTLEATSTAAIPLTLVARNSQTANLLQITNAGGTNLFLVNSSGGFISTASSTVSNNLTVAGELHASSTLTVSGNSVLAGFLSTASSTVTGKFHVTGVVNASSTLTVAGISTLYGNLNINGYATTTAASGNFATAGTIVASSTTNTLKGIGVATSTPAAEFAANGSATTTLLLDSTGNAGGCIQLKGVEGNWYHTYASTTGPLYLSAGACK